MYTRIPSGQLPRGMRVPENYAGNAFRPLAPSDTSSAEGERDARTNAPTSREDAVSSPVCERVNDAERSDEASVSVGTRRAPFSLRLPFLGASREQGLSLGAEELLLLGLILLLAQEEGNSDLILLLILLLFIS